MNFKKPILSLAATLTLFTNQCSGDDASVGLFGFKNPFFASGVYDYVGESEFGSGPSKGDHVTYSTGRATLSSFFYFNEECKEGAIVNLNYMNTHLSWKHNPSFNQDNFTTAGIGISAFSGRLCNWMFKGYINYAIDVDHPNFGLYSLWDFGAYGNYNLWDGLSLDFGFLAQTGMKVDKVWPVIGFIWQYSECIRIAAVLPTDMNIYYILNDCWSASVGADFFRTRNRTRLNEPITRAIWVYENVGINAALNYEGHELTFATLHLGYTTGGKIIVANEQYKDKTHYRFNGAPYIRIAGGIKF